VTGTERLQAVVSAGGPVPACLRNPLLADPRCAGTWLCRLNLERIDSDGVTGQDAVEALTFLADYHKDAGEYEAAEAYYTRLLDFGAGSREAAKSSLREIRTLQAAGIAAGQPGLTPVRPDSPPDSPRSDMAGMSPY
jgi:hypothetical protein